MIRITDFLYVNRSKIAAIEMSEKFASRYIGTELGKRAIRELSPAIEITLSDGTKHTATFSSKDARNKCLAELTK